MTTRTELLEIIANGENSGVEFKRDDLRTQDLAKELVAFSNLEGGMVLLGVEDDGIITGLARENLEEWIMSVCRDKIRPAIVPFFEVVRGVKDSSDVAIVRVNPRIRRARALAQQHQQIFDACRHAEPGSYVRKNLPVCSSKEVRSGPNCGPFREPRLQTSTRDVCETISLTFANRMCRSTKTRRLGSHFSLTQRS